MAEISSPLSELQRLRRDLDRMLASLLGSPDTRKPRIAAPAIESFRQEGRFVIRADLPGIDPEKLEVTVTGDVLTLRGSREPEPGEEKRQFKEREIGYGSFERSVALPEGAKTDEIVASYSSGVVELTVPVPALMPRKVPIRRVAAAAGL